MGALLSGATFLLNLFYSNTVLVEKIDCKGVNTEYPDFVLNSANTSIKVTVLSSCYAAYLWSEHCECALIQKSTDF